MKYILISLFLLIGHIGLTQIKTPLFTNYTQCPDTVSQISYCKGWRQPTSGTPDYFNVCAGSPSIIGIPGNFFGTQSCSGGAYTGVYTFYNGGDEYREYIATTIRPLSIGQTYTMTIKVSLADVCYFASDGLGALLTTYPVQVPILSTLPMNPQVDFSAYGPITNKLNWITLSQTFVADSAYTHLIVGCFKNDQVINKVVVDSNAFGFFSYYYIGEVGEPDSTWFPWEVVQPVDIAHYGFPGAFTPNKDGLNDIFRIESASTNLLHDYRLKVFNRWGQCVFMTEDPIKGWDGTLNGIPQDSGVFFYYAEFVLNSERKQVKGNVTLVR